MKIRLGFVSNSSSSSFICDYCGDVESGYDCSLEDFGMFQCENGHTFCVEHCDKEIDIYDKDFLKDVIIMFEKKLEKESSAYWKDDYNNAIKAIKKYLETDNQEVLDDIEYYWMIRSDWGVPEKYCPCCQRKAKMSEDVDYEKYKELWHKFNGVNPNGTV